MAGTGKRDVPPLGPADDCQVAPPPPLAAYPSTAAARDTYTQEITLSQLENNAIFTSRDSYLHVTLTRPSVGFAMCRKDLRIA
jgi:hypothetical protein